MSFAICVRCKIVVCFSPSWCTTTWRWSTGSPTSVSATSEDEESGPFGRFQWWQFLTRVFNWIFNLVMKFSTPVWRVKSVMKLSTYVKKLYLGMKSVPGRYEICTWVWSLCLPKVWSLCLGYDVCTWVWNLYLGFWRLYTGMNIYLGIKILQRFELLKSDIKPESQLYNLGRT
jgi:hypothetical protein